jgi:NADPH:quinone reductase-like Zn-dependent oxidoreductase
VVDYLREDFTKRSERYDAVFDAVGKLTFRRAKRVLKPGGIFISTDGFANIFWGAWSARIGDKRARLGIARYRREDVLLLKQLIEARRYRPVVDRTYPLDEVVEATRYVETGEKTGNVVLTVAP